jgi:hypothetical protein
MFKRWRKAGITALSVVGGLCLVNDSLTLGLAPDDPTTDRARGCYTWVEDVLGSKQPSDTVRLAQSPEWSNCRVDYGASFPGWAATHSALTELVVDCIVSRVTCVPITGNFIS